ncbi:hypothetical protein WR25_01083 [Diploscapter pachys]|uniref:Uncharacterized protein n=1 Tax=Diploscapter pachys TaxID=2018661 RepID=A0A2A2LRP0_9BILA|nr:hypothetical protein WR25_01083 [Diploscapter pachys]
MAESRRSRAWRMRHRELSSKTPEERERESSIQDLLEKYSRKSRETSLSTMNEEGVDELTPSLDRRRRSREQSPSISQLLKRYGSPSVSVCESRASSIVNGTNGTIGTVDADPSPIDRRPSPSIDNRSSVDRQDIDRRRSITTPRNSSELSNDSQSDSKR